MKKILLLVAVICLLCIRAEAATDLYHDGYNTIESTGVFDIYAYKPPYKTIITNDTLTAAQTGTTVIVTSTTYGTILVTLPSAASAGLEFTIIDGAGETIYVDPGAADTIVYTETTSPEAGGRIVSPGSKGDAVTLISDSTYWYIKSMQGTWTDDLSD